MSFLHNMNKGTDTNALEKFCIDLCSYNTKLTSEKNRKVSVLSNRNLHSAHTLQDSAPQPLPTTYSKTRTTHQMQ